MTEKPFTLDLVDFSLELVARMRKKVINKPSTRQAIAIPKLVIAKVLRTGESAKVEDVINAAVFTSFLENQEIAKRISEEIIFGSIDKESAEEIESEVKDIKEDLGLELTALQEILSEINLAKKIGSPHIHSSKQFLNQLDANAISLVDIIGGEKEVLKREITKEQELIENAKEELKKRIGSLTPEELKIGTEIGLNEELESSHRVWESAVSKVLSGIATAEEELNRLSGIKDGAMFYKFLKDTNALGAEELQSIAESLYNQVETLEDLYTMLKNTAITPPESAIKSAIKHAITRYTFRESCSIAENIDHYTSAEVRSSLMDKWKEGIKSGFIPSAEEVASFPYRSESWYSLLQKATKNIIESAKTLNNPSEYLYSSAISMNIYSFNCTEVHCARHLGNIAEDFANLSVSYAQTPVQLKELVKSLQSHDIPLDSNNIEKSARELGMREEEILELISPSFHLLKKAIKSGMSDFQRLSDLIKSINPSDNQIEILVKDALKVDNRAALGALGHYNLGSTLDFAKSKKNMKKVVSSLSAGSGENLLVQWFRHRHRIPHYIKKELKELAKEILIELGIHYARARLGSSDLGPIPIETTRPYVLGDDPDLIDLEETLDLILSKGKSLEQIDYDDFMVVETAKGRRAICIELDISGSMTGEKLTYMAICTTMLIYGMRRDELALAFFESDTHKVKNLSEKVNIEEVADELLMVSAMGGTVIERALNWAVENFKKTSAIDKLNVIFSDGELFDVDDAIEHLHTLRAMRVNTTIVVPKIMYSKEYVKELVKASKGYLVKVDKWRNFPDLISKIVSRGSS
ncbi:MAG TPA: VWA domain-containing protein [Methanosarcinales archaeon]|nr:VWA domain-containing protein [Methanosarcinales archaeon]